ncbi:MAG: hypothetical protein ACRECQ_05035 [Burkholderiaceae bacterium]
MNKSTVFCAALLSALATPALAQSWKFVDGEAAWAFVNETTATSMREPTQQARLADRPVLIDSRATGGFKYVGGEAGWAYVGPQAAPRESMTASMPESRVVR